MDYNPNPIDLTRIELDSVIEEDLERIARNIHEVWANERKIRGWKYDELYNEKAKTHPCLTEYDNLPELEKDMDRATVTQTIKMLLWMGYTIKKENQK